MRRAIQNVTRAMRKDVSQPPHGQALCQPARLWVFEAAAPQPHVEPRPPQWQPWSSQALGHWTPCRDTSVATSDGISTAASTGSHHGGPGSGLAGPPCATWWQLTPAAMEAAATHGSEGDEDNPAAAILASHVGFLQLALVAAPDERQRKREGRLRWVASAHVAHMGVTRWPPLSIKYKYKEKGGLICDNRCRFTYNCK